MKALRIYVDTNVIGGCCDPEFSKWSEGLMSDFAQGCYSPVLSDIVAAEIAGAPAEVFDKYAELLECGPEFITVTEEVQILAASYV